MASMQFCRECNNILYPREDKETKTLKLKCKSCQTEEDAETNTVYHNDMDPDTSTKLDIFQADLVMDPTLSRDNTVECPECQSNGAVFFRALKNFVVQWGMRSKEEDKAWAAQFDRASVDAVSSRLKDEKLATGLSNSRGESLSGGRGDA